MNILKIIVDELPADCKHCIFKPHEEIGRIGETVAYCTALDLPFPIEGRRPDCPLVVVDDDHVCLGC